ncbi:MAG: Jag N-terminal domain-containing protein, partial [Spirochaetota bacterium]|nr:Jag N-terminal domain-containing protein [Spirochaetota bacterium]
MGSFKDLKKKLQATPPANQKLQGLKASKEITGDSVEECVEKAKTLFQLSEESLSYEIIEEGSKGVLGVGKKPYVLLFSVAGEDSEVDLDDSFGSLSESPEVEENLPVDGRARMVIRKSGAFLQVKKPERGGRPVSFDTVLAVLAAKNFRNYNGQTIKQITDEASGEMVRVGEYVPNAEY